MTLKKNRAPRLCYVKLHVSFQNHQWIKTCITVRNAQFGLKSTIFLSCLTLKFDEGPSKTIGHLFYTISSFVHHFKAMGEFKLELQTGNAQFGSKSVIFFVPGDLEIWQMTLKNNRVPLLCCFKLCASFHSHQCIQTGVTVRKYPIWVKINVFCPVRPWNLTDDLETQ